MPIRVQNDLPVKEILEHENIFVMDEYRAAHQDIRPISIGLLNAVERRYRTSNFKITFKYAAPSRCDVCSYDEPCF